MPKAGQKRKKADKAKTQLKSSMKAAGKADRKKKVKGQSGIRLPKGLNETKVEVQTKSIAPLGKSAPLQRTSAASIDVKVDSGKQKKYRPIQDVLKKMGHTNHFNRLEAVKAMRDILRERPEAAEGLRADVLRRLLSLAIDSDGDVRRVLLETLAIFVPSLGADFASSHKDLVAAHLGGALSHVDCNVQRDALKVADLLVECAPGFVISCHGEILPACLSQLAPNGARLKTAGSGKSTQSDRLAVLQRIRAVLQLVLQSVHKDALENRPERVELSNLRPLFATPSPRLTQPLSVKSLRDDYRRILADGLLPSQWPSFASSFAHRLMPILMDVCCEALPADRGKSKKANVAKTSLSAEAAEILATADDIVAAIFLLLKESEKVY